MTGVSGDLPASAPANDRGLRNLLIRIATAMVLAPGTIAVASIGGWPWAALVTLVAIGLYVEWLLVTGAAHNRTLVVTGCVALCGAGLALQMQALGAGVAALAFGLLAVALCERANLRWSLAGFGYAFAALAGAILLRLDREYGFQALLLVLLVVWVTDIGGYFVGRGVGGPKLWPRVSPKKTWAGAAGGFVASLIVAGVFASVGAGKAVPLLVLAAVLSIVSQLGDLFESAVKRRFGVKDSSRLIPGHGGVLDRLDGFVAAVVVAALFGILRGAVDGAGRGLMVW